MRLIDADALKASVERQVAMIHGIDPDMDEIAEVLRKGFCQEVNNAPTIDSDPVVRCKNCKWWGLSEYNTFGIHVCKKFSGVRGESDYCSRAERNEDEVN